MSSALASNNLAKRWSIPAYDFDDLFSGDYDDRAFAAKESVLARGERLEEFGIILSGWLIRYRLTVDGGRQILHVLLPGDFIALDALTGGTADHDVETVTPAVIRSIKAQSVVAEMAKSPTLTAGLWRCAMQELGATREQLVRIGRQSALMRLPQFLLDLHQRLYAIDQADMGTMSLPLTQNEIGDILGLSNVHVNRTLQTLKREGLLEVDGQTVRIPSIKVLAEFCDFDLAESASVSTLTPVNITPKKSWDFATPNCALAV